MRPLLFAGALALGVASAFVASVLDAAPVHAQSPPDFKKAAEHYKAGEAAMAADLYLDAAREYAIAYEITRDPVLFFKIATANDKGGKCEIAVTYYRRYLKEGKPDDEYKRLTHERIAVCEGTTSSLPNKPAAAPAPTAPTTAPPAPTSPTPAPAAATAQPTPAPAESSEATATDPADPAWTASSVPAKPSSESGGGGPSTLQSAGWIALGVGAAAATVGAVMALSGDSTEQDISDLQALRLDGSPAEYSEANRERYEELLDEGDRFNTLALVSFSVAGAAVVTAATLFILGSGDGGESSSSALQLTPSVSPQGATVSAGWRF